MNRPLTDTNCANTTNTGVALGKLSVTSIGKSYGKRRVLQDISLNVLRGEIVGLVGPNGAGKTVCFYAIVGIVAVDVGEIALGSTPLTHLPMSDRAQLGLGYLPQEASIFRE